jgi:hypothetical protein
MLTMPLVLMVSISVCSDLVPSLGDDLHELTSAPPMYVLGAGALSTTAALLLENDSGYSGFLGGGELDFASRVCHYTMGLPLLGASAATWATGAVADDPSLEETGQMLTEGMMLTYGAVGILKLGIGRCRPDGSNCRSFPSAHAAGTACTAVILWDRYGAGAGVPAAAIAGFTALSRVHLGKHFPSDVVAGTAIGVSLGLAVTGAHESDADAQQVQPVLGLKWSSTDGFGVYFPHEE